MHFARHSDGKMTASWPAQKFRYHKNKDLSGGGIELSYTRTTMNEIRKSHFLINTNDWGRKKKKECLPQK